MWDTAVDVENDMDVDGDEHGDDDDDDDEGVRTEYLRNEYL